MAVGTSFDTETLSKEAMDIANRRLHDAGIGATGNAAPAEQQTEQQTLQQTTQAAEKKTRLSVTKLKERYLERVAVLDSEIDSAERDIAILHASLVDMKARQAVWSEALAEITD